MFANHHSLGRLLTTFPVCGFPDQGGDGPGGRARKPGMHGPKPGRDYLKMLDARQPVKSARRLYLRGLPARFSLGNLIVKIR